MKQTKRSLSTQELVFAAIMMALVVVLQSIPIPLGGTTLNLSLIPIVIGSAVCGVAVGGWLGFVSGVVILISGQAGFFIAISQLGTFLTVLVKGTVSGLVAGWVYRLLMKKNRYLAVFVAAICCPLSNTGIFLLGCRLFFWEALTELGGGNALLYVITVMVGWNFVAEFVTNIICAPVIHRVLDAVKHR